MKRIVLVLILAACGRDKAAPAAGSGDKATAVEKSGAADKPVDKADPPRKRAPRVKKVADKVTGPAITPLVTDAITFAMPKDAGSWWGELAFACYAGVMNLQPGGHPGDAFAQISPNVAPAMAAGGIDLDTDLAAFGVYGCGDGPCMYVALRVKSPDKLPAAVKRLAGAGTAKEVEPGHFTVKMPGAPRTLHVRWLPIAWPDEIPGDPWSLHAANATHVVFMTGVAGTSNIDPVAMLADAQTAAARLADVESVVGNSDGMCVRGLVGKRDFLPGYKLDKARFALAAPDGAADPLTKMLGSTRTIDFEVELTLTPAVTDDVVKGWVEMARAWVGNIATPIRQQYAAQGPLVNVLFDLAGVLGERGFRYTIDGNKLTFSWRTNRVPHSDLVQYENDLQKAMGDMGIAP